ncbi:MAG: NAD(P)-binding oxidoreductase [Devosia sp.]
MSRIVVVGGGGRTGLLVVKALLAAKHAVVATIRSPKQMAGLVKLGAEVLMLDLEKSTFDAWVMALKGADGLVFAAGSATGESSALDRKGTLRTLRAAEKAGVKRYVSIASIGASTGMKLIGEWATPEMVDYYKQKRAANKAIAASGLDWTIVEPGELTDGKGSGKVTLSQADIPLKRVSRADVAAVVTAVLGEPKSIGKALQLTAGDMAIADALRAALRARPGK